jgi:hypothetical protein
VLHEVGHAVGDAAQRGNVHDPEFIKAREADKAKLDSYEGQAGDAGVEETYAESFARFYSNDANERRPLGDLAPGESRPVPPWPDR